MQQEKKKEESIYVESLTAADVCINNENELSSMIIGFFLSFLHAFLDSLYVAGSARLFFS